MTRKVLGIDEAGRGSVLGSMFICGVVITDSNANRLYIKDSKCYGSSENAQTTRTRLSKRIYEVADAVAVHEVLAERIDQDRNRMTLNAIERNAARQILDVLLAEYKIDLVILDGASMFKPLISQYDVEVKAEDKADTKYPAVAAASIVAKDERDRYMQAYYDKYNDNKQIQGGGYPNKHTQKFISEYLNKNNVLPPGIRKSWSWVGKHFTQHTPLR